MTAEDELEQLLGLDQVIQVPIGYAGVEEDTVLNVSAAILYVTGCLTSSQWSDLRSGLASVRFPRWQLDDPGYRLLPKYIYCTSAVNNRRREA